MRRTRRPASGARPRAEPPASPAPSSFARSKVTPARSAPAQHGRRVEVEQTAPLEELPSAARRGARPGSPRGALPSTRSGSPRTGVGGVAQDASQRASVRLAPSKSHARSRRAEELRVVEARAREVDRGELRLVEARAHQVGLAEVGARRATRASKRPPLEVRGVELGLAEARALMSWARGASRSGSRRRRSAPPSNEQAPCRTPRRSSRPDIRAKRRS